MAGGKSAGSAARTWLSAFKPPADVAIAITSKVARSDACTAALLPEGPCFRLAIVRLPGARTIACVFGPLNASHPVLIGKIAINSSGWLREGDVPNRSRRGPDSRIAAMRRGGRDRPRVDDV